MRTISQYFARRYLGLFVIVLMLGLCLVTGVQLLLGDDPTGRQGGGQPFAARLWQIPSYSLPDLVPIAAFVAGFLSLGLASRWLEVVAAAASGLSPTRLAAPILLCALVLSGLFYVGFEVLPVAAVRHVGEDADALVFRRGAFWFHRGRSIYKVGEADRTTRTLRGVEVFDRDASGRLIRTIDAELVRVGVDGVWHMPTALVREFDPRRPEAPPQHRSEVDLRLPVATSGDLLRQTDLRGLTVADLLEYIRTRRGEARSGMAHHLQVLETTLHQRLSHPVLILLFTLLAAAAALRVGPGEDLARPAIGAVSILALFYGARVLGVSLGHEGIVAPWMASWVAIAVFAAIGAGMLFRTGEGTAGH